MKILEAMFSLGVPSELQHRNDMTPVENERIYTDALVLLMALTDTASWWGSTSHLLGEGRADSIDPPRKSLRAVKELPNTSEIFGILIRDTFINRTGLDESM